MAAWALSHCQPGSLWELIQDRNRAAILVFEFFWGLAMPFVQNATIVPGYLRHLGIANRWIGLVPAFYNSAIALVAAILLAASLVGAALAQGRASRANTAEVMRLAP